MPWCPCKGSTACFLPHVAERLLQADASKGFLSSFASDWFVFKSAILWLLAADPPREMKGTVWKAKRVSLAAFQRLVCWLTTGLTWSECRAAPKTHINRNIPSFIYETVVQCMYTFTYAQLQCRSLEKYQYWLILMIHSRMKLKTCLVIWSNLYTNKW